MLILSVVVKCYGCFMLPPNNDASRAEYILDAAPSATIKWARIKSNSNGHAGEFAVFAMPLAIDNVYIGAGAYQLQQIADSLDCMLLTPRLLDLMYAQRQWTIMPQTDYDPRMMSTAWWQRHTDHINAALQKVGYNGDGLVQSVGKPFVLTNKLLDHPGRGCNYGWHVAPGTPNPWAGVPIYRAETDGSERVIQQPGFAHGLDQNDYASTVLLVSRQCRIDDRAMDLADVYRDAELAGLVSGEGALKIVRQPGVPIVACKVRPQGVGVGYGESGTEICPIPLTDMPGSSSSSGQSDSEMSAEIGLSALALLGGITWAGLEFIRRMR